MQGWDTPRHDGEYTNFPLKGSCGVKKCIYNEILNPKLRKRSLTDRALQKPVALDRFKNGSRAKRPNRWKLRTTDSILNDRRKRLNKKNHRWQTHQSHCYWQAAWDRSLPSCHPHHLWPAHPTRRPWEVVACSESCLMLKLGSPGHCALCCLPADRDEDEWFHFVGSFAIGFCLPCHRRSQVDSLWKRISRLYTKVKQG